MNPYDIEDLEFSSLGEGSSFEGDFSFKGKTHLLGKLKGRIKMLDQQILIIGPDAHIESSTLCKDADIYGSFEGVIESSGLVTFYPTSYFKGKIEAKRVVVHPGANVNMDCTIEE